MADSDTERKARRSFWRGGVTERYIFWSMFGYVCLCSSGVVVCIASDDISAAEGWAFLVALGLISLYIFRHRRPVSIVELQLAEKRRKEQRDAAPAS